MIAQWPIGSKRGKLSRLLCTSGGKVSILDIGQFMFGDLDKYYLVTAKEFAVSSAQVFRLWYCNGHTHTK